MSVSPRSSALEGNDDPAASPSSAAQSGAFASSAAQSGAFASAHRLRSVRSRFRTSSHEQAHDANDDTGAFPIDQLPANPLIPREKARIVTTNAALAQLIDDLRRPSPGFDAPAFAYDSEFIGESTYHPRLCLVQVATPTSIWIIDPLADVDLLPFWQLIGDPGIRKIVHAGEQDLEPAVRIAGVAPKNVIDTQVLAGFCALPYPTSLAKLVEHFCNVKLGKGLTFTQWDQRPLSRKQLAYAADDVRFLPALAARLEACLEKNGLFEWSHAECDRRASVEMLGNAEEPWQRVRGSGGLGGQHLAVLRELAIWRDEAAQESDLPARALVKDEVLIALVRRHPVNAAALPHVKHLPKPVAERYGHQIMQAIARGMAAKPLSTGSRSAEPTLSEKFTADAAWALLQTIAASRGIDPNLLASRREIEAFARRASHGASVENHLLMQGWRREAAGELLLAMIRDKAEAHLQWSNGRPQLLD